MKKYNIGILGATGAVGREMLKVLEERSFPVGEIRLLASERSVGKLVKFKGEDIAIKLADFGAFEGLDFVLGAASNAVAKKFAPDIVKAGAVFIDNSSAFRMCDDVPLVVPEINAEDAKKNKGIIANPNCSTIITLVAVNAINKLSNIKGMVASTYQATSGAGAQGPIELEEQMKAIVCGGEIKNEVFQYQIAENLIPQIGSFNDDGYTTEEMKMQNEGRKILHLPELKVTCTCVRVPVVRSHSISVTVLTEKELTVDEVKNAIANEKGCKLYDDVENKIYPMPLVTSDQDLVFVGRIRKDLVFDNAITLWCCGDQVRKGAATNAIQIAEALI
ncbi:MAG: aspartate-semialdehyde dehydrogenase [Clostridia bacterium]|nr:aspartate-semialdehyde dehydrogenase [Clostridia bacterium]MBQ7788893.1 aspartate-semialdehyde dehydrogenase [Clostridia bacterium]